MNGLVAIDSGSYTPGQYFWMLAAGLLAVQAVRGWRLGVVREAAELAAVLAGYAMAWAGWPYVAPTMQMLGFPKALAPLAGGILAGVGTFGAIALVAALLLKRTEHQSVGLVRWTWGAGGSLLAVLATVFVLVVAVAGLRVFGTLFESRLQAEETVQLRRRQDPQPEPGWAQVLVQLKRELEQGTVGAVVKRIDPVPSGIYLTAEKVGGLLSAPRAMERFLAQPEVRELAQHPKVLSVMRDTQLQKDLQSWNYASLMKNPQFTAALEDPRVAELLRKVDWKAALEQAQREAGPAR